MIRNLILLVLICTVPNVVFAQLPTRPEVCKGVVKLTGQLASVGACSFKSDAAVGQQILKNCPAGIACNIISYVRDTPSGPEIMRIEAAISDAMLKGSSEPASSKSTSTPQLTGDSYWVVIASRQKLDEAIGIARYYSFGDRSLKVIRSDNNWYAIAFGPEKVSDPKTFLQSLPDKADLPKDIRLSRGERFVEQVWAAEKFKPLAFADYDGTNDVKISSFGVDVILSSEMQGKEGRIPIATGYLNGDQIFSMRIDENPDDDPSSQVAFIKLDAGSKLPQVVFTYYWHGAHCCTVTKIASMDYSGRWRVISGATLDGGGYRFEDIDNDGTAELIRSDNSFYYAFASYAESFAPSRISKILDGKLLDATSEPRFRSYLVQRVASLEYDASRDGSLWTANGFLGGWVAAKILIGEGEEAWSKMLANYDRNSSWTLQECTVNVTIDKCPKDRLRDLTFPAALKNLLVREGYKIDFEASVVGAKVADTQSAKSEGPWGAASLVDVCASGTSTVQRIITSMLTGKNDAPEAWRDSIVVHDNVTADANEPKLPRVTCSVSYEANLRSLIGLLAQAGEMRSVNNINSLMRRVGPKLSNRVKFTVQPTSKPGTTWIKVLP